MSLSSLKRVLLLQVFRLDGTKNRRRNIVLSFFAHAITIIIIITDVSRVFRCFRPSRSRRRASSRRRPAANVARREPDENQESEQEIKTIGELSKTDCEFHRRRKVGRYTTTYSFEYSLFR